MYLGELGFYESSPTPAISARSFSFPFKPNLLFAFCFSTLHFDIFAVPILAFEKLQVRGANAGVRPLPLCNHHARLLLPAFPVFVFALIPPFSPSIHLPAPLTTALTWDTFCSTAIGETVNSHQFLRVCLMKGFESTPRISSILILS